MFAFLLLSSVLLCLAQRFFFPCEMRYLPTTQIAIKTNNKSLSLFVSIYRWRWWCLCLCFGCYTHNNTHTNRQVYYRYTRKADIVSFEPTGGTKHIWYSSIDRLILRPVYNLGRKWFGATDLFPTVAKRAKEHGRRTGRRERKKKPRSKKRNPRIHPFDLLTTPVALGMILSEQDPSNSTLHPLCSCPCHFFIFLFLRLLHPISDKPRGKGKV